MFQCQLRKRRPADSHKTVTALPLVGIAVIGPTVSSKDTTRSAGASPIFTWVAVFGVGSGPEPVAALDVPPQEIARRVSVIASVTNDYVEEW
jgi:hypothetical protein